MNYRKDIDGLRAIAIVAVVLFHAFPGRVAGGFIGVDIFFVISGYLITGIIVNEIVTGQFSFLDFYRKRIIRIFPALILVLMFCMVAGWLYMLKGDYKRLSWDVLSGVMFVSNFELWQGGGYFEPAAESRMLLHLWSLGVEEQFYLIWPLCLWFCHRARLNILTATVVLGGLSFYLSLSVVRVSPSAAFYFPQYRFWELMVGAVTFYGKFVRPDYFLALQTRANALISRLMFSDGRHLEGVFESVLCWAALSILCASFFVLHKSFSFPGYWALIPTVATATIILFGTGAAEKVLSARPLVYIGLISYPLYLWHWPLLVLGRASNGFEEISAQQRVALIVVAVVLSLATYHCVERRIRVSLTFRLRAAYLLSGILIPAVFALLVISNDGVGDRAVVLREAESQAYFRNVYALSNLEKQYGPNPCFRFRIEQGLEMFKKNGCFDVKIPNAPTVFLIGDSHSASLSLGLRPLVEESHMNFLQVSTGWCQPTNNDKDNSTCQAINHAVLERIREVKPDILIIDVWWVAAMQPTNFRGGEDFLKFLPGKIQEYLDIGAKKVIVVGQIPTWKQSLPRQLTDNFFSKGLPIPDRTFKGVSRESLEMDRKMGGVSWPNGSIYISLVDRLCNEDGCLTRIGSNVDTDLVVWDYGHLTPNASAFITRELLAKHIYALR